MFGGSVCVVVACERRVNCRRALGQLPPIFIAGTEQRRQDDMTLKCPGTPRQYNNLSYRWPRRNGGFNSVSAQRMVI